MSLVPGHAIVLLVGAAPAALQLWRAHRRARDEWNDIHLDARAQSRLSAGPAVIRGRLDLELVSTREQQWGVPEPRESPMHIDDVMTTHAGPVKLVGPLVVRSGVGAHEPAPPRLADGVRVLWRQSLRIAPRHSALCAGTLAETPDGWTLHGSESTPIRAYAVDVIGPRVPLLPVRLAITGVVLAACAVLALYGLGTAAEDALSDAHRSDRPRPAVWSFACKLALGCDATRWN